MVMFPHEWEKYMVKGKVLTFNKETPADIIEKAKEINADVFSTSGKNWFNFEEDEDKKEPSES